MVARVINNINPDIAALQEMDYKTNRANKLDVSTELALKTKMVSMFAKAVEYDAGEYGQSIFSKYSFLQTGKIDLPHDPKSEPRIAAHALIILPSGDTIRFAGTHLDHQKNNLERIDQVRELNKRLIDDKYPVILAGDFNDVPGSEPIKILESKWSPSYDKNHPEPTFPSHSPKFKIDYVMFYPSERWKIIERQVICDDIASDHCAVLVTLELLPRT
jgi:endonuclease/exonuclease/phosphatase family metal-dependent hydrolase